MFVQIIEGRVTDAERLRGQMERWMADLRPGATGYLGSTAGVSDDGVGIVFARFDSAAAAQANSERPEQGAWWTETEPCFDGEVTFTDSDDVEVYLAGGSDAAGFVQVMKFANVEREKMHASDKVFEDHAASFRPDLIGGLRVWTGPDRTVEVAYFTSEAEARVGEQKEPPADLAAAMGDFEEMMADVEFIDLRDPWLF